MGVKERIVLIGAGSAMFTRGLVADVLRRGWRCDIALVDVDPEALATAEQLTGKMIQAKGAAIGLSASVDRRDVLGGATVVICTIGVGGRRAWEKDVFIPRKYGIYQPVGDSVMPGGTSRALRMIPPMVAVAEDVLDLCPQALLFNYGNPMAPVCRAVRKATGAPLVGLCHGVVDTARFLERLLGGKAGEFSHQAVGMNHLTWFTHVKLAGADAMGRLREIAAERLAEKVAELPDASPDGVHPFSWQLLLQFGAFPAPMDRHVIEFFPGMFAREGGYYGKTAGVDAYSFEKTIELGDNTYAQMQADARSPDPLGDDFFDAHAGEHEQAVDIIDSIRTDGGRTYSANLPNTGQAPNLPPEAIVESPAVAGSAGLLPVAMDPLPAGLVGTLATRLAWVETIVEAALEGSRTKFVQALILDGAVDSIETATALADELLAAHAEYLPQFQPDAREQGR